MILSLIRKRKSKIKLKKKNNLPKSKRLPFKKKRKFLSEKETPILTFNHSWPLIGPRISMLISIFLKNKISTLSSLVTLIQESPL